MGPGRNIELKARDLDPERSLAVCHSVGAEPRGLLRQRDTYFAAPLGRLKLREEEGAAAQLIAYERGDLAAQRESTYRIVAAEDAAGLKAALTQTLGVRVVVSKERRLFVWRGVRIHLDRVDDLGSFLELEAVIVEGALGPDDAERMIATLRRDLGIEIEDLIGQSYSDLALATTSA